MFRQAAPQGTGGLKMSFPSSCRIHPSAFVSPEAELGENVEIGALVIIDGKVTIGDDCVIRPAAQIYGPLQMGRANIVFPAAILGERPQHFKYNNEPTWVEIGVNNIFREHVTVHRGTTSSMKTKIGNDNFFMVNSHIAHDCVVGNRCILANGALVGGHCTLEDSVNTQLVSMATSTTRYTAYGRFYRPELACRNGSQTYNIQKIGFLAGTKSGTWTIQVEVDPISTSAGPPAATSASTPCVAGLAVSK